MAKRSNQDKAVQGGEPGHSGTTERNHAGKGSQHTETEASGAQGASDEARGRVAPEVRSDSEGPVRGTMDQDSGAGAASGHHRSGGMPARGDGGQQRSDRDELEG